MLISFCSKNPVSQKSTVSKSNAEKYQEAGINPTHGQKLEGDGRMEEAERRV